jgi:hypothetical protein
MQSSGYTSPPPVQRQQYATQPSGYTSPPPAAQHQHGTQPLAGYTSPPFQLQQNSSGSMVDQVIRQLQGSAGSAVPQYSPHNPYAAAGATGQPRYSRSHSARSFSSVGSGSDSGSDTDSQVSDTPSIEIVPRVRSEADGYNRGRTPSGNVVTSVSGQQIEFFCRVHIPEKCVENNGAGGRVVSPGFSQTKAACLHA